MQPSDLRAAHFHVSSLSHLRRQGLDRGQGFPIFFRRPESGSRVLQTSFASEPLHDSLNLHSVDGDVVGGKCMPACGVERTKPWVCVFRFGFEVHNPGHGFEQDIAGPFKSLHRRGTSLWGRFHIGSACFAFRHNPARQSPNDSDHGLMHDGQMFERHPDRPVATAILQSVRAFDEMRRPAESPWQAPTKTRMASRSR